MEYCKDIVIIHVILMRKVMLKKKRVFVKAIKNIKEGEEICYDYGEEYFVEFLKGHCMCGAAEASL